MTSKDKMTGERKNNVEEKSPFQTYLETKL